MNTLRELVEGFAQWGDAPALIGLRGASGDASGQAVWSYAELARRVRETATRLPQGEGQGRPVALVVPNSLAFVLHFLALAYRGEVVAPLNSSSPLSALRQEIVEIGAQAVIGMEDLGVAVWQTGAQADHLPEVRPESPVMYLQTSGTTSKPKGVLLRQEQLIASALNIARTYQLGPQDRSMLVMPLFHVHGLLAGLLASLSSGGAVIIAGPFSASHFWEDALGHGATWTTAVPTILQVLHLTGQSHDKGRGALRFMRSCSSALGPTLWAQLEDRFACPVVEAYGMTEASHQMASNPLPPGTRKPGSVGRATGIDISIRNESGEELAAGQVGEVCLSGPTVISHYFENPAADQACFFARVFRTGDQGYLDEDGYLFLTGRLKELINRGGEKISPVKLDEALAGHPAVTEVRCFGLPDAKYGEIVGAAVVSAEPVTADELRGYLADRLPAHEIPARWFFLEALPKSPTGKVSRVALSRAFAEQG